MKCLAGTSYDQAKAAELAREFAQEQNHSRNLKSKQETSEAACRKLKRESNEFMAEMADIFHLDAQRTQ